MMQVDIEPSEEEAAAQVRAWRARSALRSAPDLAMHIRAVALSGKTERGDELVEESGEISRGLREWVAPMRISATDDVDDLFVRLLEWVEYWSAVLEVGAPLRATRAWRNFQHSHRSAGYQDAEVRGLKPGTSPEAARRLVHLLTRWLMEQTESINGSEAAPGYHEDVLAMMSALRGRYPIAPKPEKEASPRECPLCGMPAVLADWAMGPTSSSGVAVWCSMCGQDVVEFVGGHRRLQRILGWLS